MAPGRITAALSIFLMLVAAGSRCAYAINWEGHEDWLEDSPPALEFERHFDGRVAPLPPTEGTPECQKRDEVGAVPENPYEPVPMLCAEEQKPKKK
jgi:hypothetical protein